jgi:hypothetical protein
MTCTRALSALLLAVLAPACVAGRASGPFLPMSPDEAAPCRAATVQGSPVVAEWSGPDKALLEAMLRAGPVAVEFRGCSMRVVPSCRLPGRYLWYRTTLATDSSEISDEASLWAKLPLGAASLSGELAGSGKLSMKTLVAGHLRLEDSRPEQALHTAGCERATHLVEAVSLGVFSLTRGASRSGKAGAGVGQFDAGVNGKREASAVRAAGDAEACARTTADGPDPSCASPIQVHLAAVPGRGAAVGPPGTVRVDFLSGSSDRRWDVTYDDEVICTTPCSRWLDPLRPVSLRTREDGWAGRPDRLQLAHLGPAASGSGAVSLVATPTRVGRLATGITFTALGGMAAITGTALLGAGCSDPDRSGLCTGGGISLAVGALVTTGAVLLILDSLPQAEVFPSGRPGGTAGATVVFGPGFVAGRF